MDTHRYIVLKATGGDAKVLSAIRSGVLGGAEGLRDIEVTAEAATLGTGELDDVRRAPEVLRTAPVMPVMLIQPKTEADAAASLDPSNAAWGVQAVGALTCPYKGAGVTVAVLDTGIDISHEAFRDKTIVQKDFAGEGDGDNHGHGTHCAGTGFGVEVGGLRIGRGARCKQGVFRKGPQPFRRRQHRADLQRPAVGGSRRRKRGLYVNRLGLPGPREVPGDPRHGGRPGHVAGAIGLSGECAIVRRARQPRARA